MDSSVDVLRRHFGALHGLLDTWSIGAGTSLTQYAESVVLEDVIVNGVLGGYAPLALSTWQGRTGLLPLPPIGPCRSKQAWIDNVVINRAKLRTYARAVYAATDLYLSGSTRAQDRLTLRVLTALLLSLPAINRCQHRRHT